jgi:hypothetical protein
MVDLRRLTQRLDAKRNQEQDIPKNSDGARSGMESCEDIDADCSCCGFGMQSMLTRTLRIASIALCVPLTSASSVRAQTIEPRSYSNAPVGVNFLIGGYAYTRAASPSTLPCPSPIPSSGRLPRSLPNARALDLWGMSGKFDVIVPYTWLSGSATYQGAPAAARRSTGSVTRCCGYPSISTARPR